MSPFEIGVVVEIIVATLFASFVMWKRRKLGDTMIYAAVGALVIMVTGSVSLFLVGTNHAADDGTLVGLSTVGCPFPLLSGAITALALSRKDVSIDRRAASALTGGLVGFAFGALIAFFRFERYGDSARVTEAITHGAVIGVPGLLVGWLVGERKNGTTAPVVGAPAPANRNAQDRLQELTALRDQGLLTDGEFATKKDEILRTL